MPNQHEMKAIVDRLAALQEGMREAKANSVRMEIEIAQNIYCLMDSENIPQLVDVATQTEFDVDTNSSIRATSTANPSDATTISTTSEQTETYSQNFDEQQEQSIMKR